MRKVVSTKEELKHAVSEGASEIVITGELVKEIKPLVTAMKLPAKKLAILTAFLGACAAGIIASLPAAPVTGGISAAVAWGASAPAVAFAATKSGTSITVIVLLIILCVAIGVDSVVKLLRTYDVEEDEFSIEIGGSGKGERKAKSSVVFKKKTRYKQHD